MLHDFIIVSKLVTPAIAGTDFLHKHGLTLDFTQVPVTVQQPGQQQGETHKIWKEEQSRRIVTATVGVSEIDPVDECAIPQYGKPPRYDLPECHNSTLKALLGEYKELFQTTPGCTTKATHHITTTGEPSKIPPRRIPAHFKEEVEEQIRAMLQQGVIEESNSPWMAPAVFTRKESEEIRLCVDYRELNKKTKKDAYPLPLPDEVQDNLAGSTVFTTLDLHMCALTTSFIISDHLQAHLVSSNLEVRVEWRREPDITFFLVIFEVIKNYIHWRNYYSCTSLQFHQCTAMLLELVSILLNLVSLLLNLVSLLLDLVSLLLDLVCLLLDLACLLLVCCTIFSNSGTFLLIPRFLSYVLT